jgi:hypothetical protein
MIGRKRRKWKSQQEPGEVAAHGGPESFASSFVRAINAVGDSTVLLPEEAKVALFEAWREDNEKLAWCVAHCEQQGWWPYGAPNPESISLSQRITLEALALQVWFSLDPFERNEWEVTPEGVANLRERQEAILDRLSSQTFSVWRTEAEAWAADCPFEWESEETLKDRQIIDVHYRKRMDNRGLG